MNLVDQKLMKGLESWRDFKDMEGKGITDKTIEGIQLLKDAIGLGVAVAYKGTRAIIPDTFDSIGFTRNLTESEKIMIRDTEPDQKYLAMLESPDPKDKWAVKDIEKYTKVVTDPKTGEKKLAYKTWRLKILNSPLAPRLPNTPNTCLLYTSPSPRD